MSVTEDEGTRSSSQWDVKIVTLLIKAYRCGCRYVQRLWNYAVGKEFSLFQHYTANRLYTATQGRRLRRLKNVHAGKRCFILGSGPSINEMDLTRLKDEFTFCLNAFVIHKDVDAIDPKCYISCNPIFLKSRFFQKDVATFLRERASIIKIFDYDFSRPCREIIGGLENVYLMKFNQRRRILSFGQMFFDITKELPASDTSVLIQSAIPLAIYMGFKSIYLIGCDCNYVAQKKDVNHFYDESRNDLLNEIFEEALKSYGDYWKTHNHYDLIREEWRIVRDSLENRGIEIMNAGIGGRLDVLARVSYSDVVPQATGDLW